MSSSSSSSTGAAAAGAPPAFARLTSCAFARSRFWVPHPLPHAERAMEQFCLHAGRGCTRRALVRVGGGRLRGGTKGFGLRSAPMHECG